ncbi:zinc transporter ZntB [Pseudomonas indica]|uniref:zinc transporter ZntB n=1 Tax=Pseudomonas indica TaxID=137658 RepID=UPI000BABC136|nr:zinc transporter ZntB [Pseudomonas indica]PAU56902.1 zinc transporter ZntB [Pseudomonas indica]
MTDNDADERGLVFGFVLNGRGGGRQVSRNDLAILDLAPDESLWLHWDRGHPEAQAWLRESAALNPFDCDLLLAEATRPRLLPSSGDGLLLFLRGVNLNPGAEPEDMVSLRVYSDARRVISLRLRPTKAVSQVREELERGQGPKTSSEIVLSLADYLTDKVDDLSVFLSEQLDELEEAVEQDERALPDRYLLQTLRRRAAGLKRYLAPQREIFAQMARHKLSWFVDDDTVYWNELHNSLTRNLEELEMIRERISLLESLEQRRLSERTNRIMYMLTIITGFFLPLSFFTGLMGMNVGGMPGADNAFGFALACLFSAAIAASQWLIFRWLRWL